MELADIKALIADFEAGSIRELNIEDGTFHLALSKNEHQAVVTSSAAPVAVATPTAVASAPVAVAVETSIAENVEYIKAPLVEVFTYKLVKGSLLLLKLALKLLKAKPSQLLKQ